MSTIATISDLLVQSNSQFRLYDIGRTITKVNKSDFLKIEQAQLPYPFPSQGQAFIAVVFWQKTSNQPYLWFVKLPLDERGLLNQGARNHFIAILVEAFGLQHQNQQKNLVDLTLTPNEQQERLLKNNLYHFTPAQYKLASLNSLIRVELKQNASQYFSHCHDYLSGKLGWENWQNVAIQGLTDIAARLSENNNEHLLIKNFSELPSQVLLPLCDALENQTLSIELLTTVCETFTLHTNNKLLQQHLLRALAASANHPHVQTLIRKLLAQEKVSDELLIVISGRCWLALQDQTLLMQFLEKLIFTEDKGLFTAIFKDLIAIPNIRPILFTCIRQPDRSTALAQAIGQLFNQIKA